MSPVRAAYEELSYPSFPRSACAPDRLAAVATIFGLGGADVATARVLEIGCSDGGNIIPLALVTPRGKFVGIDFAESAIARGEEQIRELKLTNIELRAVDVTRFPADAGRFDYIIVHGVFSWVPPEVQSAVLELIQRHLAPDGVAYVDYNAQPGGQLRYAFREAMRYHVQRFPEPRQRIDQARSLIKLIIEANPQPSLYRTMAEAELQALLRKTDAAMFHDTLGEFNQPLYFHQFMAAATKHGLQYLGEAELGEMNDAYFPEPVRQRLAGLRSILDKEQYLDILKNRVFRQTLLCHAGRTIHRALDGSTLMPLCFSSTGTSARQEGDALIFQTTSGELKMINPVAQAVMQVLLAAFPMRLSTSELIAALRSGSNTNAEAVEKELPAILLHAVMVGVLRPFAGPAPFTTTLSEKPIASPVARSQAARGTSVATLDHGTVEIPEESMRRMLGFWDGDHTVADAVAALKMPEAVVRDHLQTFARSSLLLPTQIGRD